MEGVTDSWFRVAALRLRLFAVDKGRSGKKKLMCKQPNLLCSLRQRADTVSNRTMLKILLKRTTTSNCASIVGPHHYIDVISGSH